MNRKTSDVYKKLVFKRAPFKSCSPQTTHYRKYLIASEITIISHIMFLGLEVCVLVVFFKSYWMENYFSCPLNKKFFSISKHEYFSQETHHPSGAPSHSLFSYLLSFILGLK